MDHLARVLLICVIVACPLAAEASVSIDLTKSKLYKDGDDVEVSVHYSPDAIDAWAKLNVENPLAAKTSIWNVPDKLDDPVDGARRTEVLGKITVAKAQERPGWLGAHWLQIVAIPKKKDEGHKTFWFGILVTPVEDSPDYEVQIQRFDPCQKEAFKKLAKEKRDLAEEIRDKGLVERVFEGMTSEHLKSAALTAAKEAFGNINKKDLAAAIIFSYLPGTQGIAVWYWKDIGKDAAIDFVRSFVVALAEELKTADVITQVEFNSVKRLDEVAEVFISYREYSKSGKSLADRNKLIANVGKSLDKALSKDAKGNEIVQMLFDLAKLSAKEDEEAQPNNANKRTMYVTPLP